MTRPTETCRLNLWLLLLLVSGFWCMTSRGGVNGATNYETPPPRTNTIKWENDQLLIKQRQESYRKRIAISPDVTGPNVPRDASLNADRSPLKMTAATAPPSAGPGRNQQLLFFAVVLAVAGVFALRKFAPEVLADLNQRFNPLAKAPEPEPERAPAGKVRAEEESFDKFLTVFKVGPSAPPEDAKASDVDLVKAFYGAAAGTITRQRVLLQDIVREMGGLARQKVLSNLRAEMSLLMEVSDFPDAHPVWQMATALEGLLKQLTDKMGNVTPSALRTVVGGVDLLDDLCATGLQPELLTDRPLRFLVVDDDMISRHALSFALGKAFTQPDLATDAESALLRIGEQAYDVIFLDVQMPGMDGFELCVKIRSTALNRHTPVVFVSSQGDFIARSRSTLSGGNDLMGKPFLTFEVTVKALALALHGRLHGRAPQAGRDWELMDPLLQTFTEPAQPAAEFDMAPRAPLVNTKEYTEVFLSRALKHVDPLRELCRQMLTVADEAARQTLLVDGFLRINSLVSRTDYEIYHPAYQMCAALDGLLRKLLEDANYSTPSTLGTLSAAVEMLHDLCAPGLKMDLASHPPIELLVVDDDLIARRAMVGALQTTFKRPENVDSGEAALTLAAEKAFDVIFLDVVMPGVDGYATCAKIRGTIANRTTPVVFVTAQPGDGVREQMNRVGGNDLLGKPFLTAEVKVKALTYVLRRRLQRGGGK
ncbi:MAG: response regulator [Verrucomicrobiae bacterium]|nr:response regulator [Verrucomicrobiae bacterium]